MKKASKTERMRVKVQKIDINRILTEGLNVRIDVGDISELKRDISERGLLQAITVKQDNGNYIIVTGRRRFESCKSLGWTKIPASIREYGDNDQRARDDSWAENVHRKNMTEEEKAKYIKDTEAWIRKEDPNLGDRTIFKRLREHLDMTKQQIRDILAMGELQPNIPSVVIAGQKVKLTEEKPRISISAAKQFNEKWNEKDVQEHLSNLSQDDKDTLRNALVTEVAIHPGSYKKILTKFGKNPLRPVNDVVAETLREVQNEKGMSATTHYPGELAEALKRYQEDEKLETWSDAVKSILMFGLKKKGYTINTVKQEPIVE